MKRPAPSGILRNAMLWLAVALSMHAGGVAAECLGNKSAVQAYRVDVVPQIAPATLFGRWAPLLDEIGKAAGLCLELRIAATIPSFEHELMTGRPDFAFVNHYHLVMARRSHEYSPLVRDGKVKLSGVLVVRADEAHHRDVNHGYANELGGLPIQAVAPCPPHAALEPNWKAAA